MWKIIVMCMVFFVPTPAFCMAGHVPQAGVDMASVGKAAPDFKLPLLAGGSSSLGEVRGGKKAMLIFWATWCPHCHEELQALSRQAAAVQQKGIKIILVDLGETPEDVESYFKYNKIELNSFVDTDSITQDTYNLVGVPTVYFLDEEGIVRNIHHTVPSDYEAMFEK